jgi:hypothetical protein
LKDGCLKSYSLLKKLPKDNEGGGLYIKNNFVYLSCTNTLFYKNIFSRITLYFNSKLLLKKAFYVSTMHSPYPNHLSEWYVTENGKRVKMYKRKYEKNYTKYNTILKKLYNYSISVLNGKSFQIFQQVAVRNKVSLNELVAIEFKDKSSATNNIINYFIKIDINII